MSLFTRDLAERVLRTFVQAALGVVALGLTGVVDLDGAQPLAIAAASAGFAAVVGLFAKTSGNPDDASFQQDV